MLWLCQVLYRPCFHALERICIDENSYVQVGLCLVAMDQSTGQYIELNNSVSSYHL